MGRTVSLVVRAVALSVVGLVVLAGPAAADPPRPGDYTSEVTTVDPDVDGVDIRVFGGDAFLELVAEPGVEVIVLGYEDEPYLRFRSDGGVDENRNSTAAHLNADRYARAPVPAELTGADVSALEPEWRPVADAHRYAWHDHRVHWMAPNAPPAVGRGGSFEWNGPVPLVVDGTRVEVSGTITYHHDVSPVPWLAGAAVVAAALGFAAHRWAGRWTAGLTAGVGAAAALASWRELAHAPAGARGSVVPLGLAVGAALLALAGSAAPTRARPPLVLAAAVVLGSWGAFRFGVLTNPVLPTSLPYAVDRAITSAAIGVVVALVPPMFLALSTPARRVESS